MVSRIISVLLILSAVARFYSPLQAQSSFLVSDSLFKEYLKSNPVKAAAELENQGRMDLGGSEEAEFKLNQGLFFLIQGKIDSALQANQEGLEKAADPEQKGRAYRYRGSLFQRIDQKDSSLHFLKLGLKTMPETETRESVLLAQTIAQTYLRMNLTDSAGIYVDRAAELLEGKEDEGSLKLKAGLNNLDGQMEMYLSNYDSAMAKFTRALTLYEELDIPAGESIALGQIAAVYAFQEEGETAIGYYERAIEAAKESGRFSSLPDLYNNMGTAHFDLGDFEKARADFLFAKKYATETGARRLYGNALGNLASTMKETGKRDSAMVYFREAESVFREIREPYGLTLILTGLGEINASLERPQAAFDQLAEAHSLAKKMRVPELEKDVLNARFSVHKQWGTSDSALFYFEAFTEIKDTISSGDVRKEIERLRIKYETELKEKENQRLSTALELQDKIAERDRLNAFVIILGLGLALTILATLFWMRNQAQKRKLIESRAKIEIEKNERAAVQSRLTQALRQITEKDLMLNQIQEDHRKDLNPEAFADKLHERINSNNDWMQFVIEFEMVYPGFFTALKPETQKLTKNDLRTAALIKLKLSNKEMAEVLNITSEGVKKSKNRLKKKLGLGASEDLTGFVIGLST